MSPLDDHVLRAIADLRVEMMTAIQRRSQESDIAFNLGLADMRQRIRDDTKETLNEFRDRFAPLERFVIVERGWYVFLGSIFLAVLGAVLAQVIRR